MLFVPPSIPFMVPEADAHYSSSGHTHSNTGQFTIDYLSISEFVTTSGESKVQYTVAGYLPAYTNSTTITKEIIKPDGTMGATDHESFGVPQGEVWYQTMGYVLDPFNASGWTMKVCAPEFGQCVEQNFTISFAFLDADTTPPVVYFPDIDTSDRIATNSTGYNLTYMAAATEGVQGTDEDYTNCGFYPSGTGCSGYDLQMSCSPSAYALIPVGTTTVTCTATDAAGNVGTASFTVTVVLEEADTTPPVLNVPSDQNLNVDSESGITILNPPPAWLSDLYAYDAVTNSTGSYLPTVGISCSSSEFYFNSSGGPDYSDSATNWRVKHQDPISGQGLIVAIPIGTHTVTCTATDYAENTTSSSFVVTVNYTEPGTPVISFPAPNRTFTTSTPDGYGWNYNSWGITASDDHGVVSGGNQGPELFQLGISCNFGTPFGTGSYGSAVFPVGVTTVTCTATDAVGNVGTGSFTVTVNCPSCDSDSTAYSIYTDKDEHAGEIYTPSETIIVTGFALPSPSHIQLANPDGSNVHAAPMCNYNNLCGDYYGNQWPGGNYEHHIDLESLYNGGHIQQATEYSLNLCSTFSGGVCNILSSKQVFIGIWSGTTLPTITLPADTTFTTSNSTGFTTTLPVTISDATRAQCPDLFQGGMFGMGSGGNPGTLTKFFNFMYPIGQTTLSCTATNGPYYDNPADWENTVTASFVVTVNYTDPDAAAEAAAAQAAAEAAAAQAAAAAAEASLVAADAVWVEANPGMVKNTEGSSSPGCTPNCFIPSTIAISTGDSVTWVNLDMAAHTTTSGTPGYGSSDVWNSNLMMAGGTSFAHTFDTAGTYPYFCLVHPWMVGTVIVTGAAVEEEIVIPSWIKNNAGWWDAGLIDDRNYVTGLQWLISNGVMTIPSTAQGTGSDDVVPSWVKNNAGWWADGSIDDRNYVTGLQWLISNGIMIIG